MADREDRGRQTGRDNPAKNSKTVSHDQEIWQADFAHPPRPDTRKKRRQSKRNSRPVPRLSGDEALQRRLDAIDQRKARASALKMVFFVVLTLSLTIFMIYMILSGTKAQPQLYVVQLERVREQVSAPALLQREEIFLQAPAAGYFRPAAAEGERRSVGSLVAYIVPEGYEDILSESDRLAEAISTRQLELIRDGEQDRILEAYLAWDRQLFPLIEQLRVQDEEASLDDIRSFNLALDDVIRQRSRSLLQESYRDPELEKLVSEYTQIQETLSSYAAAVTAPAAGHLSYLLEEDTEAIPELPALDPETAPGEESGTDSSEEEKVSIDGRQLAARLNAGNKLTLRIDEAEAGETVARMVTGAWQELHYLLPADRSWEMGASYSISVPAEGITISNCELISARVADNHVHLIFRTDQQVEHLAGREIVNTRIENYSSPALRVPIEAIIVDPRSQDLMQPSMTDVNNPLIGPPRYSDSSAAPDGSDGQPVSARGRTSIYRLESGFVNQIPVEILTETDTYALVRSPEGAEAPLAEGQIIILNPDSSTPGAALGD